MTTIGDKANMVMALLVIAWLLTDSIGAWL